MSRWIEQRRPLIDAFGVAAFALTPLGILSWLLTHPRQNFEVLVPRDHFMIVTAVSFLAVFVAVLVVRSAFQIGEFRSLLLALGLMIMAGLFGVHGLTTPGILVHGSVEDYGGTVTGLSAYLSIFIAAIFFAARDLLPPRIARQVVSRPRTLTLAVGGLLALYAAVSVWQPHFLGSIALANPPASHAITLFAIAMLGYSAWHDARLYLVRRRPVDGASALALIWLADAQIAMILAPPWTLAWWEYHGLMLGAVLIALAAELIELDRRRNLDRFLPSSLVDSVMSGRMPSLGGERREITIVFADLRDSTALAESLEPEEMAALLNEFLGAVAGEIARFEGTLDKFLGDGLMAFFGDNPGHLDHTERAVRAAFGMQQRMRQLQAGWEAEGRAPLGMGVGIARGVAIVGTTGSASRMDFTAIGSPVNIASRLTALAQPGQILTTRKTYWHVLHNVVGVAKPPTTIKGFCQPLEVVELVGTRLVPLEEEDVAPSPFFQTVTRALSDEAFRSSLLGEGRMLPGGITPQERDAVREIGSLMDCPLFSGIPAEEVGAFVVLAAVRNYEKGSTVVRQSAEEDELYVILRGRAEVFVLNSSGSEQRVATLERGEVFGEIALLFDTVRTASVRATSPVTLLAVHRDNCYEVLRRTPVLRSRIENVARSRMTESFPVRFATANEAQVV
ncbi:MAG: adenylate/guanylate cyclase with Chase sensor [Chloroflexi bacterium]|nr:adenylate/guanylate cyclase with Chase sensor [Chloroflexota bacterium]